MKANLYNSVLSIFHESQHYQIMVNRTEQELLKWYLLFVLLPTQYRQYSTIEMEEY